MQLGLYNQRMVQLSGHHLSVVSCLEIVMSLETVPEEIPHHLFLILGDIITLFYLNIRGLIGLLMLFYSNTALSA